MKLITKIKKAKHEKKNEIFYAADLDTAAGNQLLDDCILSLPKGLYHLYHREGYNSPNIIDEIFWLYGSILSHMVTESFLLGMQVKYPKRISVSFTHDMNSVELM